MILPYLLIAPALLLIGTITVYPSLYVFYTALTDWSLERPTVHFVALHNFFHLTADPVFWHTIRNTLGFLLGTLVGTVLLGLMLAILLNERLPGRSIFRSVAMIPFTISSVVAAVMWRWMVQPDIGILNYSIASMLDVSVSFLFDSRIAIGLLVVIEIWANGGYAMTLFLGGLQGIDPVVYEAAAIDGANARQRLQYVTLPLLTPTILVSMVLLSIHAVNQVALIVVLTGGGPARLTETVSVYMWKESFSFFNIGYGSAVAVVIFLLNLGLTLLYLRLLSRHASI